MLLLHAGSALRFNLLSTALLKSCDRFEQVDHRIDQVDQRINQFRAEVAARFTEVAARSNDHDRRLDYILWSRFGMRLESLFRRTMVALLEQSFGVGVEQRTIAGEQFHVVIHDQQHVLVEIADSVGRTIQTHPERKSRLYEESTGMRPARIILATASIHSARGSASRLRRME